ncbi:MAG: amidohydrolase family protein, partial [Planctomycetota bacterium]|nr:amidohydrolase family protein [Planctomycetota bacterium]
EAATGISYSGNSVTFTFTPPDIPAEMTANFTIAGNAGSGSISAFGHDMDASVTRMGSPEKEAVTQTDKTEEADDQASSKDFELGHPEWLVETKADRTPQHILKGDVLLKGSTLYPMTGEAPYVGDLLIQGGRIAGIGPSISTLKSVPTINAVGWHITPGVIDPHSHLSLDGINEGSVSISAECSVDDMIRTEDVGIWRAAAGGTAVVQSLHGSANPIGGQAAVWELNYWEPTQAGLRLPGAPQGIKFALGENVKQSNWSDNWGRRFPDSRMGVQAVYRRAFTAAQDYARRKSAFEAGDLPSFRRDVRLETLADILAGKIHIQCHSYRADELQMFLGICEEFGIRRPTFQHVLEGYKLAPEIAAYGAMASTFSDWWAYKFEVYDAIPWNVALLTRAGVTTTINSDSDEMIRRLNTEAGKSLRYGQLSIEECLALCTLNGAKQLHVEERLGSLEVGKDGTITAFDGPPLSTWSRCTLTLARGRTLFERNEETDSRWEEYALSCSSFAEKLRGETESNSIPIETPLDWGPWTRQGQGISQFIHNVVIHSAASPTSPPVPGAVHIQDGRILWLGASYDGSLPAHTEMIDGKGMGLYPTFINTGDQIGLMEVEQVRSSRDDRETGKDHPDLSIASAIHSDSRHIRVTRMSGIGHALSSTVSGRIRGQAALIQMDGDTTEEMVVLPDIALHISFPGVKKAKPGDAPSKPSKLDELDRWMDDSLEYGKSLEEAKEAGGIAWSRFQRNPKLEALLPYALGNKPVILDANGPFTLMAARNWAKERNLDPIYSGAMGAWKIAGFLGADQARVLLGSVHSLPRNENDPFDSPYRSAGILEASGCKVGLRTGDTHVARNLPFQAATAGAHGAGPNNALHFLSLGAAEALGISAYTGSIEVGKAANFFLAEGDPLDNDGQIRRMWLGGAEVELSSEQTRLRDRYQERIEFMTPPLEQAPRR